MSEAVEYRPVAGCPGYRVGSDGSVWSCRVKGSGRRSGEWHRLSTYRRPYGSRYVHVSLRAEPGGRVSCHYVHVLVLGAFAGPCPDGMQCCHYDGDTANNDLANLRWDTPKANAQDRLRHGTHRRGSQVPTAVHTEDQVMEVFRLREQGMTQVEIAARLGFGRPKSGQSQVSEILRGKKWKHVMQAWRARHEKP